MSQIQLLPLRVTRTLFNHARGAEFSLGEDTAMVAVQHMLLQTVDLFQTIGAVGINLKNVFALGKVYSNSPPVIRALRDMGVTVVNSTTPEPGEFRSYFQRDVERLWQVATETLRHRNIRRILVLDDAGVCITNAPPEILQRYGVCGVEQTSQGMFLFEKSPPPFAVISWARSAVKLQIGGPIFSQSFMDKLNREHFRGRSMRGVCVGVIGFGSIGRAAAKLALRYGANVLFYDPDPHVYVPETLQAAVKRAGSLEELMATCECVAGCSGRNPFKDRWPMNHRPEVKLFSASGGDEEFGPIIHDLKTKPDFEVNPDTWTITSKHGPSGPLEIAYLGYPYNFVSRATEAVPTEIVQLETGGLLAALVQARFCLDVCDADDNKGLHRVAPKAQRFVYETWLDLINEKGINLTETFGYDEEMLNAARHEDWFIKNTDVMASQVKEVEDLMTGFLNQRCAVKVQGEH